MPESNYISFLSITGHFQFVFDHVSVGFQLVFGYIFGSFMVNVNERTGEMEEWETLKR